MQLLLRELYAHGSLEMSSACLRVLGLALTSSSGDRQSPPVADQACIQAVYAQISGAFARLAQNRFIQRLPDLAATDDDDDAMDGTGVKRSRSPQRRVPLFVDPGQQQSSKYWLPTLNIQSKCVPFSDLLFD